MGDAAADGVAAVLITNSNPRYAFPRIARTYSPMPPSCSLPNESFFFGISSRALTSAYLGIGNDGVEQFVVAFVDRFRVTGVEQARPFGYHDQMQCCFLLDRFLDLLDDLVEVEVLFGKQE